MDIIFKNIHIQFVEGKPGKVNMWSQKDLLDIKTIYLNLEQLNWIYKVKGFVPATKMKELNDLEAQERKRKEET